MVADIFTSITSALTAFIGTLNSGLTEMVGLFYANGALTVVGTLMTIVVAVSLCWTVFRIISGLIRLRG